MRSLKAIQLIHKIGMILSKIVYICCIVGLCACLVGAVAMGIGEYTLKLGGMTLHSFLQSEADVGIGTIWIALIGGAVLCIGEYIVSKKGYAYFKNELDAGTPFTADGTKELFRLGIYTICVPIITTVAVEIIGAVICEIIKDSERLDVGYSDNITLGVMLIFASLICSCATELIEKKNEGEENAEN